MTYLGTVMMTELGAMLTAIFVGLAAICLALLITCGLLELRWAARTRRGMAELEHFLHQSIRGGER